MRSALSVVACAALCESFGGADQAAKRPTAEVTIFILPCACLSLRTKCCFYVCQQGTKSFRSESGGRSAADIVICLIASADQAAERPAAEVLVTIVILPCACH